MISIVVPIINEEEVLSRDFSGFAELSRASELVFVDGGSSDKSVALASKCGTVFVSEKGRAQQMNTGARKARHDILLFLHADNAIVPKAIESIEKEIREGQTLGGCLTQRIDKQGFIFRLIEWQGNNRARRTKIFYGDQGIFVRKDVFAQLGGFPDVPVFEDVLFTQKLKGQGKTAVLPDKIMVSPRRWEKCGILRTMLLFNTFLMMFKLGYPLEKIQKGYEDIR